MGIPISKIVNWVHIHSFIHICVFIRLLSIFNNLSETCWNFAVTAILIKRKSRYWDIFFEISEDMSWKIWSSLKLSCSIIDFKKEHMDTVRSWKIEIQGMEEKFRLSTNRVVTCVIGQNRREKFLKQKGINFSPSYWNTFITRWWVHCDLQEKFWSL